MEDLAPKPNVSFAHYVRLTSEMYVIAMIGTSDQPCWLAETYTNFLLLDCLK